MRHRGWWIAGLVVLLTNVIVLFGAARNRSGEPDAIVELTERELPRAHRQDEDTGMALRLEQGNPGQFDWFDRAKLEELGFDCSAPPHAGEAEFHYGKQLPRRGYLVLEYDGAAWQGWFDEQREQLRETAAKVERGEVEPELLERQRREVEVQRLSHSRLFPVDAGGDARVLRQRHPARDRVLILPAVFRIEVVEPADPATGRQAPPVVRGAVAQLLGRDLHVNRDLARRLRVFRRTPSPGFTADPFEKPEEFTPQYSVTVKVGRRHEPWIDRVQRAD